MRLTIEMHNPEAKILEEIADRRMHQKTVAIAYAFLTVQKEGDTADWGKINQAIADRWSPSGRIKKQAWKIVMEWCERGRDDGSH